MRKKKLLYNIASALVNQVLTLICGFILPNMIIRYYGSETNGLVSSITQFLGLITLLDMGVGAVVQSELYRPLAQNDNEQISKIVKSSNKFFGRIGIILGIYTTALMIIYPLLVDANSLTNKISTSILVFSISISQITQYFFGVTNQIVLNSDQRAYVCLWVQSACTVLNTIVSVVFIRMNFPIHLVKFISGIVLMLRPMTLAIYVRRHYSINRKITYTSEPIKQKWNAVWQQVSTFVVDKTDIAVLTILGTLKQVSIYSVYHLVVAGLYQIYYVMTTGLLSLFGDMYARNETDNLRKTFGLFEWLTHSFVIEIYTCAGFMLLPFISLYTHGVNDADYHQPAFGVAMCITFALSCLRLYYYLLVKAAGKYKETQRDAIVEAFLNVVISVAVVRKFGLIGVAVGTIISMSYRTITFVIFTHRNILRCSYSVFLRQIIVDALLLVISINTIRILFDFSHCNNYYEFLILGIKVVALYSVESIAVNLLLQKEKCFEILKYIGVIKNNAN